MKHLKSLSILLVPPLVVFLILFVYFQDVENVQQDESSRVSSQTVRRREVPESEGEGRLIFIGDTGTGNENQYKVADAIKGYCEIKQDCSSVYILGDVIYPEGVVGKNDIAFTEKFESPYFEIELPFYILYGNHDYLGCIDCYLDYHWKSDKWNMPSAYYINTYLDSSAAVYSINTEDMSRSQLEWLSNDFETSENKWKIVLGHRPIISYEASKYQEDWSGRDELKDVICHDAELYISGHSHLMEDNGKVDGCNFIQLISGAGGAYIRDVVTPHQGEFYHKGYGFLSLSFSKDKLQYEFVDSDLNVLYSNDLEK